MKWGLKNANIIKSNSRVLENQQITINGNNIKNIADARDSTLSINADIEGLLCLPGFINSHDHLLGSYFPRVGDRRPYLNWLIWDNDLKESPIYIERQRVDSQDLYKLGAYRNLISGFTSVQDHIPHFVREKFAADLPIRLVDNYTLAHSVTSFALPWGSGIQEEHEKAVENNIPFITHCSEGFDEETKNSVEYLKSVDALTKNTVLIHGIAFSEEDIDSIQQAEANVVWCPYSNLYMFEKTAPIKKLLDANINVCLGTDSPMSGSINLFEEIQVAKNFYQNAYHAKLDNSILYNMLTENPAKALCLNKLGELKVNNLADILVVKPKSQSISYSFLENFSYEDIMLVVIDGIPKFADKSFEFVFQKMNIPYEHILVDNSHKILYGNISKILDRIHKKLGYNKFFEFLPVMPI